MAGTCFVALWGHSDLPELLAPRSLKPDPNVEAGSSADFSLAPLTCTGCVAACAAAGTIRKAEAATAIEATILVRKDIIWSPVSAASRPGRLAASPPRDQSIILRDISVLPRMSLSCDMQNS